MTLIAILGLIWAVLSIVWLIIEIVAAVQSIVYFGTPVSAGLVLGFGWKMTGLLLITAYLLPAIKPAIVWVLKIVCGWLGIGQVSLIEAGVNVAADAAQAVTGGINSVAGGLRKTVATKVASHSDVCSRIMAALGGPDYVEVFSYEGGKMTKRVFGTPPSTIVQISPASPAPAPQPQPAQQPNPPAQQPAAAQTPGATT